ncbi:hypothetical protein OA434_00695 [Candidatus Pelagibacter sp.]|nr:hypothetical protein [Candidatus Pelagibacter sp.]
MAYFYFVYTLLIIIVSFYFKKKLYLSNYTGDNHQLFSNYKNIPLLGGLFLITPILLINYENVFYFLSISLIFLIGFFSDRKILISPKKRFLFQIALIFLSVFFLKLEILFSRINYFDYLLQFNIFNIFFTSFCLLILLNGSNFIDGLNGLLLVYMTFVIIVLLKLNLISELILDKNLITYLIIFLAVISLLNFCNLLMLGDAGAYILSFFVGYLIITCHKENPNISPYFFISIIWYPCYENLFSIIRKLKYKFSPLNPDNQHLHQLLYTFIKKNFFSNKLIANNASSLLINTINLIVIYVSSMKPHSSVYQIRLIIISLIIYTLIFIFLKNKNKSL